MSKKIVIPAFEIYDERADQFIDFKEQTLTFEHSLVSLSKWESKWHIPFIKNSKEITSEQLKSYIKCMTLTQNVDERIYDYLPAKVIKELVEYIEDPMTATWFSNNKKQAPNRQIVTAEIIYYWMVELGIPFECQKWHLNRLLTLIRVCNEKQQPQKKMPKAAQMSQQRQLNAMRRARMHTKG